MFRRYWDHFLTDIVRDAKQMTRYVCFVFWVLAALVLLVLIRKLKAFIHKKKVLYILYAIIIFSVSYFVREEANRQYNARPVIKLEHALKLMSFNLRNSFFQDKVDNWEPVRRNSASEIIRLYTPDIIGIQEGNKDMLDYITNYLSKEKLNYVRFGKTDYLPEDSFDSGILYNKNELTVIDGDTFWLSETPNVQGSKLNHSFNIRTCTWLHFIPNIDPSNHYFFFNTHLDHFSEKARRDQMSIIMMELANIITKANFAFNQVKIYITGDFNTMRRGKVWDSIINNKLKIEFKDSLLATNRHNSQDQQDYPFFTFHAYRGHNIENNYYKIPVMLLSSVLSFLEPIISSPFVWIPTDAHIDWIITNDSVTPSNSKYNIVTDSFRRGKLIDNRYYPSDHYPILLYKMP